MPFHAFRPAAVRNCTASHGSVNRSRVPRPNRERRDECVQRQVVMSVMPTLDVPELDLAIGAVRQVQRRLSRVVRKERTRRFQTALQPRLRKWISGKFVEIVCLFGRLSLNSLSVCAITVREEPNLHVNLPVRCYRHDYDLMWF